jgi:diguanylate cyclase (GGDEF)-like protein
VLFLDLDRFKVVNDSKGHAAGDDLLRAVADRLRRAVRPADTVARLGGDEFVIVCEDICGEGDALAVARRLAAVLGQPLDVAGREVVVTASIGAAVGTDGAGPDELLRRADLAMYQAKAKGRARAIAYDETLEQDVAARLDLEADLRMALREGQLRVVFQPQWSLAHGGLLGVEALVRWAHPARGLLGPGAFLDLAEETGLIREIGTFVLEAACATARRWVDVDPRFIVSVNLSARQLDTPGFAALVAGVLHHHRLAPANLCVEVTETLLIDLHGGAARQLAQLRSLGVQVALDDFGTGWSSLSHLTSFPVDVVKVDRAFVAGLDDDLERHRSKAVVSAVVGLAHDLGLTTVAEGAETAEHVERLRALGCDSVQGFFLGRPEPPEVIDRLVADAAEQVAAVGDQVVRLA